MHDYIKDGDNINNINIVIFDKSDDINSNKLMDEFTKRESNITFFTNKGDYYNKTLLGLHNYNTIEI